MCFRRVFVQSHQISQSRIDDQHECFSESKDSIQAPQLHAARTHTPRSHNGTQKTDHENRQQKRNLLASHQHTDRQIRT
jgi:hypothetical protein